MTDRTPLLVGLIGLLALLAVYVNLDLFRPGYQHPRSVTRWLSWQGEPPQRSLRLREGLDLQGGLQVLLEADMTGAQAADLEQAASTIQNRVDALGVIEPLVQTQGADKIVVELPGVADPDLAVRTIGQTALLEFIYSGQQVLPEGEEVATSWTVERALFHELPEEKQKPYLAEVPVEGEGTQATEEGLEAAGGATATAVLTGTAQVTATAPVATTAQLTPTAEITATAEVTSTAEVTATSEVTTTRRQTVYPTVITGDYLRDAQRTLDRFNQPAVSFMLTGEGGRLLQRFTAKHVSSPERNEIMPITLDGKVISSPRIQDEIADQGQITGNFTVEDADVLVAQLRSGALPVPLTVVGQTRIGPTLGREAVDAAIRGGVVGFLVVMLFMLIYYRMPGLLADLALVLYALLVLSLFRLLPVTLTLAGIAGFVLSIGMAVDANILIFERMKEELRSGKRIRAAMDMGFQRAWPSIRDSNLSTLITCAILFWFGNQFGASIVKGFAVTLALGVLTSLFTAITVTRTLLRLANRIVLREEVGVETMESPRLRALFGF